MQATATSRLQDFLLLIRLGLPILGAQLAQMGMGVVDTVMAGRVSAADLAGVAVGGAVMWPVIMGMMGVLQAVTPSVSQLNGEGKRHEVGALVRQALWMALAAATLVAVLINNAAPFYRLLEVDPAALKVTLPYLQMCTLGLPAIMIYFVFRFMCEGLGYTKPAMVVAISALLLKIPLNYWFIHGGAGVPAMGGVGCGVATAVVMWFECLAMLSIVLSKRYEETGWRSAFSWPDANRIFGLMRIGVPIGCAIFFEFALFTLMTILLGRFGAQVVAAHSIVMNIGGLTFMFPFALGMAATIRIGYYVGSRDLLSARRVGLLAVTTSLMLAVVMATLLYFCRSWIADLYSTDAAVTELAERLMLFIVGYMVFDNLQATAIGALRGYKDTRVSMLVTLTGYWVVGLPVAVALGYGWFMAPMGAAGFWTGLTTALVVVALASATRLWWLGRHPGAVLVLAAADHR
ncbi:MAG: MATE family efflux transporter [Pseudomonadales bacterium]|nr:MATE family efflux transporter [Pseudomonadales bacterium]